MAVNVRVVIDGSKLQRLLRSPTGPVARDMLKRGQRVQSAARRRINSRSGNLARSITVEIVISRGAAGVRIGTDVNYAEFVHEGTGIYGPRRRPIRPTSGKVLAFQGKSSWAIVTESRGQRPNRFLRNALRSAK